MNYQLTGNALSAFNTQYASQNLNNYLNSKNALGISKADNPFSKVNIKGTMTALTPVAGGVVGGLIGGGYESDAGSALNTIGDLASVIPGVGGIIGGGAKVLGGITNALFGSKVDQAALNAAKAGTAAYNNFTSNANSFDGIQGPTAQAAVRDAYSDGLLASGASSKNLKLKQERAEARARAFGAVDNNINNIASDQINDALASFYALGGALHSNGADWSNGIINVGNGGTHEQNPFDGVQMGIDEEGVPNLVEENEVIFNDYVFSNRIKVPKAVRNKYKLRGVKDMTFAETAKKVQKESEERPNDSISKRSLNDIMGKLMFEQEGIRQKREERKAKRMFATGGPKGNMYVGVGHNPNILKSIAFNIPTVESPYPNAEDPRYTKEAVDNRVSMIRSLYPTTDNEGPSITMDSYNAAKARLNPTNSSTGKWWDSTYLRYAPVVGAGIGLAQGLLSKPDYSNADMILNAAKNAGNYRQVGFNPIGNYLRYTPLDRMFYANQVGAQAGATRRNILNTSGGNRASAMAGLLSADYNAQTKLGEFYRQAEEYNAAQRERVAAFNRDTDKFNSEGFLKADIANQEAAMKAGSASLSGIAHAAGLRQAIDAERSKSISANFSNLFTSLGNIGEDAVNRRDRDMLIMSGVYGMPSFKPYGWSDKKWDEFKEHAKKNGIKAQGGKVNRRKKGLII